MKITVIGAGNMGGAIVRGLVAQNAVAAENITVTAAHASTLDKLKKACGQGLNTTTDNAEAVAGADVIILAVKPWLLLCVLEEIAPRIAFREQVIVSVAAGVSLSQIDSTLQRYSSDRVIFRAIPNTAISVAASTTLLCRGDNATDKELELVNAVFKPLGTVVELPESRLNAAMAVTSCGIAYVMRFVRATVEGAVELGLSPDQALGLCIDTLAGTSALLGKNGSHPEAEIDKVTTPGGLTIRGLNAMEEAGFSQSVIKGLRASLPSND